MYCTHLSLFKGINAAPHMMVAKTGLFYGLVLLLKLSCCKCAVGKIRALVVTR